MKQTSTIHSVDTELVYAVLRLSFSKQYKVVLILYARASQTFLFCGSIKKKFFLYAAPLLDSLDVNDSLRVNVSLQISRCICVNGEIIQMHTILESNYAFIKLPRNGNSKVKNN